MSRHPRTDLYREAREKGLSYREIAKMYGVSFQTVAFACGRSGYHFKPFTEKSCVYPYLRKWLNDNSVSRNEFIRRMGCVPCGDANMRYGAYFRGECYPSKQTIDRMLQVTGLTYEQLFYREDGNG